jgi:hypothetical protein
MTLNTSLRRFLVGCSATLLAMASAGVLVLPSSAEEAARENGAISPDKQWEFQFDGDQKTVIAKAGTKETVLDLSENVPPQFAKDATLLWTPDSKRFAINYRAGGRWNTTALYQLRADKWVALRSPEANEIYEPLNRAKAAQLKKLHLPKSTNQRRIWDTTQLRSWTDADTAILFASSDRSVMFNKDLSVNENREDTGDLVAGFIFTLKFDARGNWKIVKTHQMSDKEMEAAAQ